MSVIRLRAGEACSVCGSTTGLPHATRRDCLGASEREPRETTERPYAGRVRHSTSVKRLKSVRKPA